MSANMDYIVSQLLRLLEEVRELRTEHVIGGRVHTRSMNEAFVAAIGALDAKLETGFSEVKDHLTRIEAQLDAIKADRIRVAVYHSDDTGAEVREEDCWLDEAIERTDPEYAEVLRLLRAEGRCWVGGGAAPLVRLALV